MCLRIGTALPQDITNTATGITNGLSNISAPRLPLNRQVTLYPALQKLMTQNLRDTLSRMSIPQGRYDPSFRLPCQDF
jgi:hypothetical protein